RARASASPLTRAITRISFVASFARSEDRTSQQESDAGAKFNSTTRGRNNLNSSKFAPEFMTSKPASVSILAVSTRKESGMSISMMRLCEVGVGDTAVGDTAILLSQASFRIIIPHPSDDPRRSGEVARLPHRRYSCVMRPLRYSINVTLDGCCDHRAGSPDEELHRHAVENLDRADALFFGRVTYEMMEAAFRPPAGMGARPDWMEP